uniref:VpsR-related response regulator n=1 Tax=uncultured Stenotrophomonas sp. TaxID=165438 RepID=UPI0028D54559
MAAVPEFPARCVIWFGQPHAAERAALAAEGWQVRGVASDQCVSIGMRSNDLVVGLLDLRGPPPAHLDHLQGLLAQHRHMRLLAILPAGPLPGDVPLQALLACCVETWTAPLDVAGLVLRLQQLADGEGPGQA